MSSGLQEWLTIDRDVVFWSDGVAGVMNCLTVHLNAAFLDHGLRLAPTGETGACDHFRDSARNCLQTWDHPEGGLITYH